LSGSRMPLPNRRFAIVAMIVALFLAACSRQQTSGGITQAASGPPTIVFMTDLGTPNDPVAICRAVIYSIAPDVRITDITHQVTPFSIEEAARFLEGVTP